MGASYIGTYGTGNEFEIGTDLIFHHPVSFTYDPLLVLEDDNLNLPSSSIPSGGIIASEMLYNPDGFSEGKVECGSCHAIHNNQNGDYLRFDSSTLFTTCHILAPTWIW